MFWAWRVGEALLHSPQMSSVQDRVREAVKAIQGWLGPLPGPGEAVVRQAIVLRLLQAAGFDIWNPAEVVPEETNGSGNRADFLIRAGGGTFPLEVKGMNASLQPAHYQQVVAYAANEGTRWALLTNGRVWVVLDRMHNPAGTFLDHEVLKLELAQEGETFADDLAALLDAETWRAGVFAAAVQAVKNRQQQRLDEARILAEKKPWVQAFQRENDIGSFEKAVDLASRYGEITEAERDVLLGLPTKSQTGTPKPSPKPRRQPPAPMLQPFQTARTAESPEELHFTYRVHAAEAHAVYRPAEGTWTVKAGSTSLNRVLGGEGSNARGIAKRRREFQEQGQLAQKSGGLLEYLRDVTYSSASMAAVDIAGASRNGWECWKDADGRPAQYHRPNPQPG